MVSLPRTRLSPVSVLVLNRSNKKTALKIKETQIITASRNCKFLNRLMSYFHSRLEEANDRKWRNALQNTRLLSYYNQQRRCT